MKPLRTTVLALLTASAFVASFALSGCGFTYHGNLPGSAEESRATRSSESPSSTAVSDIATDYPEGKDIPVLMLGRSVMGGWFAHWGWDWESQVSREGYALDRGELSPPPEIADVACEYIAEAPAGAIVFFKFCFEDFWGEGGEASRQQLEDMKVWVMQVADCARDHGMPIVIGNALPKVAQYTDSPLVEQHEAFNEWLEEFASGRTEVYVVDQYSVLAGPDGALRPEFALSEDDSHLNETAYEALDPVLFATLDEAAADWR
ncbi:MAG: hypothetical protein Kow0056_11870 [Coriobacteriia bacterium]